MSNSGEAIAQKIMQRVLGSDLGRTPSAFFEEFMSDIPLVSSVESTLSGQTLYTSMPGYGHYVGQQEVTNESAKHDWLWPKEDITSLEQLQELVKRSDFMAANRMFDDSTDVYRSDDVGKSSHVYDSMNIVTSNHIVKCSWIWDAEYLFGCQRSGASTFCMGLVEAQFCTDSYRVFSSHKVTRSMFIKSSYDLMDCLWCAHLRGKRYCIGNMQYSKEEYELLKARILQWLF
jgi:hypothetical protein